MGLILVAHATNVISEPFPWLLLNRLRETCLTLHFVKMAVCRTEKYVFILIIIVIIIAIAHLLAADKKRFHMIWTKKVH